jgi:hypothetical protein
MKSPASRLVSSIRSTPAHRRRIEKKRLQRRKLAPPRDSALEGGFAALSHANGTGGVNHRRIFRRLPFSYWGVPPLPRSFGIIGLGGKSRQVFGFKGLTGKVFRNKDLGCQRALKWVWGSFEGRLGRRTHFSLPQSVNILALGGVGVCDGDHGSIVMIKFKASSPSKVWTERPYKKERLARASRPRRNPTHRIVRDGWGTRQSPRR